MIIHEVCLNAGFWGVLCARNEAAICALLLFRFGLQPLICDVFACTTFTNCCVPWQIPNITVSGFLSSAARLSMVKSSYISAVSHAQVKKREVIKTQDISAHADAETMTGLEQSPRYLLLDAKLK